MSRRTRESARLIQDLLPRGSKSAEGYSDFISEDKIPNNTRTTTVYDQLKNDEDYLDDHDYDSQPYRHITKWFLSKKGQEDKLHLRLALPKKPTSFSGVCLYGELVPSQRETEKAVRAGNILPQNLKVCIVNPKSIDRSTTLRGIWVVSKHAWYNLKEPCSSQTELHIPMRAKFGLVSNIADMVGQVRYMKGHTGLNTSSFVAMHSNQSPEKSYKVLCASPEQIAQARKRHDVDIETKPFDFELLRREAKFVKENMKDFDPHWKATCAFVKGLSQLEKEFQKAKREKQLWAFEDFDYVSSAAAAEQRSRRNSWGDLLPGVICKWADLYWVFIITIPYNVCLMLPTYYLSDFPPYFFGQYRSMSERSSGDRPEQGGSRWKSDR
eukprot:scaffold2109_cov50-Attheya_sp.AAC.1